MVKIFVTMLFSMAWFYGNSQEALRVTISNKGDVRERSIISFPFAESKKHSNLYLVDDQRKIRFPVQVLSNGYAFSIVDIRAGETRIFELNTGSKPTSCLAIVKRKEEIQVLQSGQQVIGFQTGEKHLPEGVDPIYRRGGYVHPVFSPGGIKITDDYPLDHKHHHGIWAAWTKTLFRGRRPDFWNVADNTGAVVFNGVGAIETGPILASIPAKNAYIDKTASPHANVLNEDFSVKVFNIRGTSKPYYLFDIELKQECATMEPLQLLNHIYGGIAFRGNGAWNGKDNASFLTSDGKNRATGNATNANWIRVSGIVDNKLTGITILSHPANFRAPQPLRIHPTEPYISFAPSQSGEFNIKPGETYIARYRFIVYDGEPDTKFIDRMWKDYSNPLIVEISSKNGK